MAANGHFASPLHGALAGVARVNSWKFTGEVAYLADRALPADPSIHAGHGPWRARREGALVVASQPKCPRCGTIATVVLIGILSVKVPDWPTASMMNELAELKSDAGHQRTDTRCVEARRDDEL